METKEGTSVVSTTVVTNSQLPSIEKLDGSSNYNDWKFFMELYLIHEDLWDCVITDSPDVKRDQKAKAKICLMIKSHCLPHVRTAKTAKEAWNNLKGAFEDKGLIRRLSLLRKLFGMKLEDCKNMQEYVTEIMMLAQQLQDINSPLEDEFIGVIMLSGLTPTYDPMVMALENSNVKITSDLVKCKLLQEDVKRNSVNIKEETALYSQNKFRKPCGNYQNKKTMKCYNCQKFGHKKSQCRLLNQYNRDSSKNYTQSKEKHVSLQMILETKIEPNVWYVDSGATTHMTNRKDWLNNFDISHKREVTTANSEKVYTAGIGDITINSHKCVNKIKAVSYVPNLSANLLSVNSLVKNNLVVLFSDKGCQIYHKNDCHVKGNVLLTACNDGGMYKVNFDTERANAAIEKSSQRLWHRRLGHLNRYSMDQLKNGMAFGIKYVNDDDSPCISCIKGKQTRLPFKKTGSERAKEILGLVHSDICGPMNEISWGGARYLLTFIDDLTRKTFGYFLKSKGEVQETFEVFKKMVENETSKRIKILRTDNGGEYTNKSFEDFLKKNGIRHQTTVEYTSQQNGIAERANRTILDKARTMIEDVNLRREYWAEAVNTVIYLKNRSPTKAVKNVTPEEAWTGKKINLSYLKIFGCRAFAYIPQQKRKKLDSKSRELIFVGYCSDTKGYRLIDPSNPKKIIKSRDVFFIEEEQETEGSNIETREICNEKEYVVRPKIEANVIDRTEVIENEAEEKSIQQNEDEDTNVQNNETQEVEVEEDEAEKTSRRYPQRIRKPVEKFDALLYQAMEEEGEEPKTVENALNGNDARLWKQAMKSEYHALQENKTWCLVDRPKDKQIIKNKWVFKVKRDSNGNVNCYKARLVAKGFTQEYGVDYEETFSPVVRHSTIRLLFALAAKLDLDVDHMDVVTAFLNGYLEEEVYMEQPECFITPGKENKVCLLKRSLYGLKQASRSWNKRLNDILVSIGFKKSEYESCIYYRIRKNVILIIAVYVDDLLIFSNDVNEKNKLKDNLRKRIKIKDLGEAKHVLGIKIDRNRNKKEIMLNQEEYIKEVLEKFGMSDCKPAKTPIEAKGLINEVKNEEVGQDKCLTDFPYQQLIGSLMYLSVCTRPDISYATSYLSQYNTKYNIEHWQAAKRVLRYLKGTMKNSLVYRKSEERLVGYADADWGNDKSDRKSYTGYLFTFGGTAFAWESRKQRTVALSSTEAEYMALGEAVKEGIYLKGFMKELMNIDDVITIYNDNQSAQKLSSNPVAHKRTKHIDVRHHFLRDVIDKGDIKIKYMQTSEMVADVFTKGLSGSKHEYCVEKLGIVSLD